MTNDLHTDLESTRDLLRGSLQIHATDNAPSVPSDLLEDMVRRFNSTPVMTTKMPSKSWFAAAQAFIARPAFGVAALAVAILGVTVPSMMKPADPGSGFRGAIVSAPMIRKVHVVLLNAPSGIRPFLDSTGDFEKGTILSANPTDNSGATVFVDFETNTIKAIDSTGNEVYSMALPAAKDNLSAAIATALSRL